jgi:hypothetical protein
MSSNPTGSPAAAPLSLDDFQRALGTDRDLRGQAFDLSNGQLTLIAAKEPPSGFSRWIVGLLKDVPLLNCFVSSAKERIAQFDQYEVNNRQIAVDFRRALSLRVAPTEGGRRIGGPDQAMTRLSPNLAKTQLDLVVLATSSPGSDRAGLSMTRRQLHPDATRLHSSLKDAYTQIANTGVSAEYQAIVQARRAAMNAFKTSLGNFDNVGTHAGVGRSTGLTEHTTFIRQQGADFLVHARSVLQQVMSANAHDVDTLRGIQGHLTPAQQGAAIRIAARLIEGAFSDGFESSLSPALLNYLQDCANLTATAVRAHPANQNLQPAALQEKVYEHVRQLYNAAFLNVVLMPGLMMDPSVLSMEGRPTIQIQRAIAAITNPPTMANRSQFDPNLLRTPVASRAMLAANNALDRLIESTVGRPSERADEKHSEKHSEPRPNRRREDFGAPGLDFDHNARQSSAAADALMRRVLTAATAPTPMPLPEALNDRAAALANALTSCNTLPEIAACAKQQVGGFEDSVFLNPLIVRRLTELQLNPDIREFIAAFGKNPLLAVSLPIGSAVRNSMDGAAQQEFASEQLEFLKMLAQGRHLNPDGAKAIGRLFEQNASGEQVINVSGGQSQALRDALNALEDTASAQECHALFERVYGGIYSVFAGGAMARLESGRL